MNKLPTINNNRKKLKNLEFQNLQVKEYLKKNLKILWMQN